MNLTIFLRSLSLVCCFGTAALLAAPSFAQSPQTDAAGVPSGGLIEKFDNWEVRKIPGQNSFLLVGNPADNSGQLWLMCEHKSHLTVAVSMTGRAGRRGIQKSQTVKLQIDDNAPRDFSFIVFESFVALATEIAGSSDERVGAFLAALRDVKNSLILTYDDTSHAFDVSHLQKARQSFLRLCGRHPA